MEIPSIPILLENYQGYRLQCPVNMSKLLLSLRMKGKVEVNRNTSFMKIHFKGIKGGENMKNYSTSVEKSKMLCKQK